MKSEFDSFISGPLLLFDARVIVSRVGELTVLVLVGDVGDGSLGGTDEVLDGDRVGLVQVEVVLEVLDEVHVLLHGLESADARELEGSVEELPRVGLGQRLAEGTTEPVDYPLILEERLKRVFQWQFTDAGPHIANYLWQFSVEEKRGMLIIGEEDDGTTSYSVSEQTVKDVQDYLTLIKAPTMSTSDYEAFVDLVSSDDDADAAPKKKRKLVPGGRKTNAGGAAAGGAAPDDDEAAGGPIAGGAAVDGAAVAGVDIESNSTHEKDFEGLKTKVLRQQVINNHTAQFTYLYAQWCLQTLRVPDLTVEAPRALQGVHALLLKVQRELHKLASRATKSAKSCACENTLKAAWANAVWREKQLRALRDTGEEVFNFWNENTPVDGFEEQHTVRIAQLQQDIEDAVKKSAQVPDVTESD